MKRLAACLIGVFGLTVCLSCGEQEEKAAVAVRKPGVPETAEEFARRTGWWREAKFGMFIHWGIYAVPGDGEWHMSNKKMQVADYERYAPQFNPVEFNAREWVAVAKSAGMKYLVITAKHHDGFCMWDTKLSNYNVVKATPFRRDVIKEMAAACKKEGIRFCCYYSLMDWHHPDYLPRREWEMATRPARGADLNRYIDYMKGQLRELLTDYGRIGVIWFDAGAEHDAFELRSAEVNAMIRSLQPDVMINARNMLPEDFETPEQNIPEEALPRGQLWETCMTLNDSWGWSRNDRNWKSAEDVTRKLIDIASKGGNFLMNVGPTDRGRIPQESIERLVAVGQWLKVNGESIYGTTKSPFKRKVGFNGRCTQRGEFVYLHVFDWPTDGSFLRGLKTRVKSACFLHDGSAAVFRAEADKDGVAVLSIQRPGRLDPIATVVRLELAGPIECVPAAKVQVGSFGKFDLWASEAEIVGETACYESGQGKDDIGYWTDKNDYVYWPIRVEAGSEGDYAVEIIYSCDGKNAGSVFTVGISDTAKISAAVRSTGQWEQFRLFPVGRLQLSAGEQKLAVKAVSVPNGALMNLKEVILTKVP